MLEREDIYRIFKDKDVSYVFNRVIIDPTEDSVVDIVKVRASLLEEDLMLTDMESLMVEMLLGDQYINFYQHMINLEFDKRTVEDKLQSFSESLYKWVSERLGYMPEWVLGNREEYIHQMINKMLEEEEDYLTDSEVLLGLLLMNTQFTTSSLFKESLRKGVWSSTVTSSRGLDLAEEYYTKGLIYPKTDSLSLYLRLAARGYRGTDLIKTHIQNEDFDQYILSDKEVVYKGINNFMWKYARGEDWSGYTGQVYDNIKKVNLGEIEVSRANPNQILFTLTDRGVDYTVNVTFSDKISVTYFNQEEVEILYNREYYMTDKKEMGRLIERYAFRNRRLIPIVSTLIRNLPIDIPTKENELDEYK